jgi:hypothetical protein
MSRRYTGVNPNNQTSKDINYGVSKKRRRQPGVATITNWKNEWIERGLDKKMTFIEFKGVKAQQLKRAKKAKKIKNKINKRKEK